MTGQSLDVSDWPVEQPEARGGSNNQWRRDAAGELWLYKATRAIKHSGELQGEDWAEKAAERLGALLGVPTARVEVAHVVRDEGAVEHGVVSKDLAGSGSSLQGGFMLFGEVEGYEHRDGSAVHHGIGSVTPSPTLDICSTSSR